MAQINIGGRIVDVPDDLNPASPQNPTTQRPTPGLRSPASIVSPIPQASEGLRNPSFATATSPQASAWARERAALIVAAPVIARLDPLVEGQRRALRVFGARGGAQVGAAEVELMDQRDSGAAQ